MLWMGMRSSLAVGGKGGDGGYVMTAKTQGASLITVRKELEIGGITRMRLNQMKNKYFRSKRIVIADVFSGSGVNVIGDEIVDGSPVRLVDALNSVMGSETEGARALRNKYFHFWFSDIRKKAVEECRQHVSSDLCLPNVDSDFIAIEAASAINELGEMLYKDRLSYLILVLDPNGPKAFPRQETIDLIASNPGRVDVIPNLSATAINRCLLAREKTSLTFPWLSRVEGLDKDFIHALANGKRSGWIRKPISGDPQRWFIVPTYAIMKPRNAWEKQGYVSIATEEGIEAIDFYSGRLRNGGKR